MWPNQLWEIFSGQTSSLIEFFVVRRTSRSTLAEFGDLIGETRLKWSMLFPRNTAFDSVFCLQLCAVSLRSSSRATNEVKEVVSRRLAVYNNSSCLFRNCEPSYLRSPSTYLIPALIVSASTECWWNDQRQRSGIARGPIRTLFSPMIFVRDSGHSSDVYQDATFFLISSSVDFHRDVYDILCYIKLCIISMIHTDCSTVAHFQLKIPVVREWNRNAAEKQPCLDTVPICRVSIDIETRSIWSIFILFTTASVFELAPFTPKGSASFVINERKVEGGAKTSSPVPFPPLYSTYTWIIYRYDNPHVFTLYTNVHDGYDVSVYGLSRV